MYLYSVLAERLAHSKRKCLSYSVYVGHEFTVIYNEAKVHIKLAWVHKEETC